MKHVGILAYGSLIPDPGAEIANVIVRRIEGVLTPFNVEFARKSTTRHNAPTLVPVARGGSRVRAQVLVMKPSLTVKAAEDMLYRREIHDVGSRKTYKRLVRPNINDVVIERLTNLPAVEVVLCTKIAPNIDDLTPANLAELAIRSAKSPAGDAGEDGIRYLMDAKRHGIRTPLMREYENEILRQTGASTLEQALRLCLRDGESSSRQSGRDRSA